MSSGIIAKKVGMSRIFLENGEAVPVTYLQVEPNTVVRTKTEEKDGYNAVVLGVRAKKLKTRKGKEHTKYTIQKEWRVESVDGLQAGSQIGIDIVPTESMVTVSATSKGKGFQGVIKRHKFSRGPETHGSHHHRATGSIGMKEWPGRVLKGKKMPGRMGTDKVTVRHRSVLISDPKEGILAIKGPVPGPNGGTVYITFEFEPEFNVVADTQDAAPAEDAAPEEKAATEEAAPAESSSAETTEDRENKAEEKEEVPTEDSSDNKAS